MAEPNLSVNIGRIKFPHPVLVASGTFGYGEEFKDLLDLSKLGGIITKTITLAPKEGNLPPRIAETAQGMLNAIGLENAGVDSFIKEKLPNLLDSIENCLNPHMYAIKKGVLDPSLKGNIGRGPIFRDTGVAVIVSIAGEKVSEYTRLARRLSETKGISGLELNISCPNIRNRQSTVNSRQKNKNYGLSIADYGLMTAQDARATYRLVKAVRRATKKTLITKLSPNVTDIVSIAKAAEDAGSDAVSLVNTFLGMAVDINTKLPKLGNITGGLSGPAIKPLALKKVWEVAKGINIPVIGMGGIMDAQDALEFIICGASAVAVGTANFINPRTSIEIINGIKEYLAKNKIKDIKNLTGSLKKI